MTAQAAGQDRPPNSLRNRSQTKLGNCHLFGSLPRSRPSSRTPVPNFSSRLLHRFFFGSAANFVMGTPFPSQPSRRLLLRGLFLALVSLASTASLVADTSGLLRPKAASCYCHCAVSRASSGCAKMCESARYASRWWATSCARPHRKATGTGSGASPRLPHPARAEHARVDAGPDGSARP
jgi:hypothetical protein